MNIYKEKYEKYKKKYLDLKKLLGGLPPKPASTSKAASPPKAVTPPKEEPSTKPPNPRALNIECYNKKFKLEYDDRTLSIISILNECLIDSDKWDDIIGHIFNERKSRFPFLSDLDVIDLLNLRFKSIKANLDKDRPYTFEKLIAEINKIDEELNQFLRTNPDQDRVEDLREVLSFQDKKSIGSLPHLVAVSEKVKEELIPMTEEKIGEFLHKKIIEQQRVPIQNKPLTSSLVFNLPESIFPAAMIQRYNFNLSDIDRSKPIASRLQLDLFRLSDGQVYEIIRELFKRFHYRLEIDEFQYMIIKGKNVNQGRGVDYCHFSRPFNNINTSVEVADQTKRKINLSPFCQEIMRVGIIFEFLERIKFLVQNNERQLARVAKALSPDKDFILSSKNHIRQIIDLYIYITRTINSWNLVIQLYNTQRSIYSNQLEIYDDMSLIISFINYYISENKAVARATVIHDCIEILYSNIDKK